ncbi:sarcosine oxidase subunit gamma [Salinisphaera sp. Q1T1-3]|uniref:sarcosine oxidase subunit gamma n=1 Tax=Salinisphaera sp. Q1T1-3 TaxID=2321229 RepID=UPI000E712444|nr:sarcosine oxidase subunit gamma family protein [Salinisphaera sp. Q1T1-3]RJS94407.1 sarcosine oxidase subunit gamma [Salinisphaera sp. Q1T1-3]
MSEIKIESPLVDQVEAVRGNSAPAKVGVRMTEHPFLGQIVLRGKSSDTAFTAACAGVLGCEVPTTPNTYAEGQGVVIAWMGPTEWLVLVDGESTPAWLSALRGALADVHAGVLDTSGGQTLISLEGPAALDVLAKGSTLDLHPRVAPTGFCTRSLLAKSAMFVRVVEAGQRFEIVVRRSFADYLWQWLVDAGGEYGLAIQPAESTLVLAGLQASAPPKTATGA